MTSNIGDEFRRIQAIADLIRRDVETSLNTSFTTWKLVDYALPPQENNTNYRMKIQTDDNGYVQVKTTEKVPGERWDISIEEYERGTNPLDTATTTTKVEKPIRTTGDKEKPSSESLFGQMQAMADLVRRDVETALNENFTVWELLDCDLPTDGNIDYYRMKIRTDHNGYVKVKVTKKVAGERWDIHVEEFSKGNALKRDKTAHVLTDVANIARTESSDKEPSNTVYTLGRVQSIANQIRKEVEAQLNRGFMTWEVLDYTLPTYKGGTDYRIKIKTGEHDYVTVRTSKKGRKDWKVHVEEYKIDNITEKNREERKDEIILTSETHNLGTSTASQGPELSAVDRSVTSEIQSMAKRVKGDVETILARKFEAFGVVEHTVSFDQRNAQYNMRIKTDDNDHVKVNVLKMESRTVWTVHVDAYDRGEGAVEEYNVEKTMDNDEVSSKRGQDLGIIHKAIRNQMESVADCVKNDVELLLGLSFHVFEVLEYTILSDLDETYYKLRVKVDGDGTVTVRVSQKMLGKVWNIQIDEYDKGVALVHLGDSDEKLAEGGQGNVDTRRDFVSLGIQET